MRHVALLLMSALVIAGCADDDPRSTSDRKQPVFSCDRRVAQLRRDARVAERTVKVYVFDGATSSLDEIARKLAGLDGVSRAKGETKEEAFKRAKRLFKDSPEVLDNLPGNPFPASVTLTVDPDHAKDVVAHAQKIAEVDEAEYQGDNHAIRAMQQVIDEYDDGDRSQACRSIKAMTTLAEIAEDAPDSGP